MVEVTFSFENHDYRFELDAEAGTFSLLPIRIGLPKLCDAELELFYHNARRQYRISSKKWIADTVLTHETIVSNHGRTYQCDYHGKVDLDGLQVKLTFMLLQEYPLFLWCVEILNQGEKSIQIERIEMLRTGTSVRGQKLWENNGNRKLAFFSNGWQSWAFTAVYGENEPSRRTRLPVAQTPMIINPGTPQPREASHYSSDFFGIVGDRESRSALLLGFLSQEQHFGSIEARIKDDVSLGLWANGDGVDLNPGETMQTDMAVVYAFDLNNPDPLQPFLDAVIRQNHINITKETPIGWCSWYQYYDKVTASQIMENLDAVSRMQTQFPLNLLQIDDGFENQVGDWFNFKASFPDGVTRICQNIKDKGLTPGLWLAPFIVNPKSQLYNLHPDFILRNSFGFPVNAGYGWGSLNTALDLTHPGAIEYSCQVVEKAVHEWGFPYLKLDFLYAGALKGIHRDRTKTRAQILRNAMADLRKSVGDETFLLGCGLPLGSALGLVDAMRIGADVSGNWNPMFFGTEALFKQEPHMPSARNSIQNILTRANLHHQWWINDADCLLVRPDTNLTLAEVQSLATVIALTGGAMLLSDDLTKLPVERRRIVEVLLPLIDKRAQVLDWFDRVTPQFLRLDMYGVMGNWYLLAWFNWSDEEKDFVFKPEDFHLPDGRYWISSFWDNEIIQIDPLHPCKKSQIQAHGNLTLAVRPVQNGEVQYLGSNLHISQGMEVADIKVDQRETAFTLDLPRDCKGEIYVTLPGLPRCVTMNDVETNWQKMNGNCISVGVNFKKTGILRIQLP